MNRTSAVFGLRLRFAGAMAIFGTIGIFVRYVDMPSALLVLIRGLVGMAALFAAGILRNTPLNWSELKKYLLPLCLSGAGIGLNWVLLFEAYRYTSVATATLCYYMAPIFLLLASAVLFRERLGLRTGLCIAVAFGGMVLVSGILDQLPTKSEFMGILLGLGAAVLYAGIILYNRRLPVLTPCYKTAIQLGAAAVVVLPYLLASMDLGSLTFTPLAIVLLLILGLIHTGLAYWLYFGALPGLPARTVAVFSYIDPVTAILLSALILKEPLTVQGTIGAVLILGAALVSELPEKTAENSQS